MPMAARAVIIIVAMVMSCGKLLTGSTTPLKSSAKGWDVQSSVRFSEEKVGGL